MLERVGSRHGSTRDAFDDWLSVAEASLAMLPEHGRQALRGKTAEDSEETRTLFARCAQRWGREGMTEFADMTGILMEAAGEDYLDLLGDVFMEISGNRTDQFFTPMPVAQMMAQINSPEALVHERLKSAIEASPVASAMLIAGAILKDPRLCEAHLIANIIPNAIEQYKPVTLCDPACGSGVMFIAQAACLPAWMTQLGLVQFYGQDIDVRCVRMTKINIMLYGLNGFLAEQVVLRAAATLRDAQAWKTEREEPTEKAQVVPDLAEARRRAEQLQLFAHSAEGTIALKEEPDAKAA